MVFVLNSTVTLTFDLMTSNFLEVIYWPWPIFLLSTMTVTHKLFKILNGHDLANGRTDRLTPYHNTSEVSLRAYKNRYFWGNLTVCCLFHFNIISSFWKWQMDFLGAVLGFSICLISLWDHSAILYFSFLVWCTSVLIIIMNNPKLIDYKQLK